jgi:hypothetical protein
MQGPSRHLKPDPAENLNFKLNLKAQLVAAAFASESAAEHTVEARAAKLSAAA